MALGSFAARPDPTGQLIAVDSAVPDIARNATLVSQVAVASDAAMAASRSPVSELIVVAGLIVRVDCATRRLADHYLTALVHHSDADNVGPVALHVSVWDSESTGVPCPEPMRRNREHVDFGSIADPGEAWSYSDADGVLTVVDPARCRAWLCMDSPDRLMEFERAAPLLGVLQWLMLENRSLILHAGAVGLDGTAAMVVGAGGAGKSTTVISALGRGLEYYGDDLIAITPGSGSIVHGLFGTAKSEWSALVDFPFLENTQINMPGGECEKAIHLVSRMSGARMPVSGALGAVLFLDRFTSGPRVSDIDTAEVRRVMASSTYLIQRIPPARLVMGISRVLRDVPVVRFRINGDLDGNAEAIGRMLEGTLDFAEMVDQRSIGRPGPGGDRR